MEREYVLLEKVRLKISVVWLAGTGLIGLILILQCMLGKYQDKAQDVWSWALPTIIPTLSLILSTLGAEALKKGGEVRVRRTFYKIAMGLSAAYLFLILLTIVVEPFTSYDPLALLRISNLWLGPLQGLVASSIGVLFFSRTERVKKP